MVKHAFSLVELSIVLVILGLLTGGILFGQNLIRAAELKSVITEFRGYQSAATTFIERYEEIPGDMRNAEDFWGSSTACSGGDAEGVCNGDGDGIIDNPSAASTTAEPFQFWRHLAKAGLIAGEYTGLSGANAAYNSVPGENSPFPKITDGGWIVLWRNASGISSASYDINVWHHFHLGSHGTNEIGKGNFLVPEEAWSIDDKIDDGLPARGQVIADVFDSGCTTVLSGTHTDTNFDAEYNLPEETSQCGLYFINVFE